MQPNFEAWDFLLALCNAAGVMVVGVYTWWTNRDKATADAIEGLRSALENQTDELRGEIRIIEARVSSTEHDVGERLRLNDLSDLYDAINRLNREMGEVHAGVKAISAQIHMQQEFLMKARGPFDL